MLTKKIVIETSGRKHTLYTERFENPYEVVQTLEERPLVHDKQGNLQSVKSKFLYGTEEYLDMVKKNITDVDKTRMKDKTVIRVEQDVVGFSPIIPNVLMGVPKTMYNQQIITKKNKVLDVLVDTTYAWHEDKEDIAEYYSKLLAFLVNLEKSGFRIRLEAMCGFSYDSTSYNETYYMFTKLKNEFQPLEIKKMMFALVSDRMLRDVGFEWYEKLPKSTMMSGYGKALHHASDTYRRDVLKGLGVDQKSKFYIWYKSDFQKIFEGVK